MEKFLISNTQSYRLVAFLPLDLYTQIFQYSPGSLDSTKQFVLSLGLDHEYLLQPFPVRIRRLQFLLAHLLH
jgi:hypothetical protein